MREQIGRRRRLAEIRARLLTVGPVILALALVLLIVLLGFPRRAAAQSLEESLTRLGAENARLYAHPIVAGLGANLNAGFFHTASVHRPLGFDVSVRAMGSFAPVEAERFDVVLPEEVTYRGVTFAHPYGPAGGSLTSPTAVGAGPGIRLVPTGDFRDALVASGEDPASWNLELPEGLDLPAVPAALAQVSLGLPLGTEVAYRFIPTLDFGDDVGEVSMRGFGVKHSIDQWLPVISPLQAAVSAGYQSLEVGDYLTLEARQVSLVTGRDLGLVVLYGGLGLESTEASVDYLIANESGSPALPEAGTRIRFDDQGENTVRTMAGITFDFPVLKLNAQYSRARYPVANAKLLISVR